MEENLVKRLMASIKCNICGQRYEVDDISIIGHEDDLWFLGVFCAACHTRYLVAAEIKEDIVSKVITDLNEAEPDSVGKVAGLTGDDVLDMHNFLKEFDGDFSRLFGQK